MTFEVSGTFLTSTGSFVTSQLDMSHVENHFCDEVFATRRSRRSAYLTRAKPAGRPWQLSKKLHAGQQVFVAVGGCTVAGIIIFFFTVAGIRLFVACLDYFHRLGVGASLCEARQLVLYITH